MAEYRPGPLMPRAAYLRRLARHGLLGAGLMVVSLVVGMAGYRLTEHLSWADAYLNATMLMGGMGPVNPPATTAGKVFAGTYALYCGLVLLIVVGVVSAPVIHRFLHRMHLESQSAGDQG